MAALEGLGICPSLEELQTPVPRKNSALSQPASSDHAPGHISRNLITSRGSTNAGGVLVPGPCLEVEYEPPMDQHLFGCTRFHRSMGPAVGLVKMLELGPGRVPRRRVPVRAADTEVLRPGGNSASSTGNLLSLRRAEIADDALTAASMQGGCATRRIVREKRRGAPIAPGCCSSVKKLLEFTARSDRSSPGQSRETSTVLNETQSSVFSTTQESWLPAEEAPPPSLPRSRRAAPETEGNFPAFAPGMPPPGWHLKQKRAAKLESGYTSRMRAILAM